MRYRIYLSLEDNEAIHLQSLLNKNVEAKLTSVVNLLIERKDIDKYIRHNVFIALSDISGVNYDKINESDDLNLTLGLGLYHKKALKNYFQRILNDLKSSKKLSVKECEELKKVNDCLNLIKSKL